MESFVAAAAAPAAASPLAAARATNGLAAHLVVSLASNRGFSRRQHSTVG